MRLKSLRFSRFEGEANEWCLVGKPEQGVDTPVTFGDVNLIVGKNATGKTKTVMAIRQLADLLAGKVKLSNLIYKTSKYEVRFSEGEKDISYILDFKEGSVIQEQFVQNGKTLLDRKEKRLYYEEVGKNLSFDIDENMVAASRVDKKQQSFFEGIYSWAKNLNLYRFGTPMGKGTFLRDLEAINDEREIDLKDSDEIAEIFIRGKRQQPETYEKNVLDDMREIDYHLDKIETSRLKYIPVPFFGISVKEKDVGEITDQHEMSQGMFRALSLIVQLNYALQNQLSSCILIDDIGEGLDYERSKRLIELIIKKVEGTTVQVIMTTNNRFVMNKVPLEYWSVIHRQPQKSVMYNYRNSKVTFDEFAYTGLSNFDFLSSEFYREGFEETA